MAFSTTATNIIYEGDGVETEFPIPFKFVGDLTIIAELWDKTDPDKPVKLPFVRDVDYTIADYEPDDEDIDPAIIILKAVNTTLPVELTQDIFIYRETEAIRASDYTEYRFPYKAVNVELDRITLMIQELKNDLTRVYMEDGYESETGSGESVAELFERVTALEELVDGLRGLPEGGELGAVLAKATADDFDMQWNTYGYEGFSAHYNKPINTANLDETLQTLLDLQYLAAQVALSASGSGTIREKGTSVTSSNLSANVTKRSNPIARIQFFLNGVAIAGADYNPPANTGSGVQTHAWAGSFSDNSTFRVDVTDVAGGGGPNTVSSSVNFTFVYPYYFGSAVPSLSASGVGGLAKHLISSSSSVNRSFTAVDGDVFYFAYPASYGALTSIKDVNNFETLGSWTLRTENITGLNGSPVSYRIYEFNNVQVANTTSFTFIR